MKYIGNYVFFYGGYLSNFAEAHFVLSDFGETHEFFCSEQAFMWAKAKFFGDESTANAILSEKTDPMTCKSLGRMVQNYDDGRWASVRYEYMKKAVFEKFRQNTPMLKALCDSKNDGKTFVEASPTDGIWGIRLGLNTQDNVLLDEKNWRGTNLLGKVINDVRLSLIELMDFNPDYEKLREMTKLY